MKKIKNFDDYIKENILFPRGGDIGGEHKKPVSDEEIENGKANKKGYKPQHRGITNSAYTIENEKRAQRKINLMGSELKEYISGNSIMSFIDSIINYVEDYKKNHEKYLCDAILNYIKILPIEVIEHFNIDLNSDNLVEDFIENKYELFKRSYQMFKEIKNYPVRYEN